LSPACVPLSLQLADASATAIAIHTRVFMGSDDREFAAARQSRDESIRSSGHSSAIAAMSRLVIELVITAVRSRSRFDNLNRSAADPGA
jgi:hypothetical protein